MGSKEVMNKYQARGISLSCIQLSSSYTMTCHDMKGAWKIAGITHPVGLRLTLCLFVAFYTHHQQDHPETVFWPNDPAIDRLWPSLFKKLVVIFW